MTMPPMPYDGSIANTTKGPAAMAIEATQVNIDERKAAGRAAAQAEQATKPKPFGQTSPTAFPYTYWYVVGYNDWVEQNAPQ